ncbi:TonB-dependent receptor plug domain-containing protein, partial [Methylorubrum aminovorans]
MGTKRHKPEDVVAKLRQVDVLVSQGQSVAEAIRAIGVTEVTYYRWRKEYGGLKSFYVRGFSLTYDGIFRDGLRQIASGLTMPRIQPYGIEAATILRGPASGLYG